MAGKPLSMMATSFTLPLSVAVQNSCFFFLTSLELDEKLYELVFV